MPTPMPTYKLAARALLVGAFIALAAPARADQIDAKLHAQAPAILKALKDANVSTVGTLRFRVERGKKPDSFQVGPINDGLAARLENLLIIHADKANPIGVLKNPGTTASVAKVGSWYTNAASRRKLFELEYPTAWGNKKAKADAFLTGEVRCTGDMTKTTVVIEMFTAQDPTKFTKLVEFTVPTDRLILADLGERFSVPRGNGLRRSADLDRFAIGEVRKREDMDGNGDMLNDTPPASELNVGGVTYRLLAGEEAATFRPSASAGAKWEVPSPAQDKEITMVLKNTTAKRVGVVLKVNETSTIFFQTEDSALCRKWVIEPDKEIKLKGFYQEDKQYAPFKVLVGDEAKQAIDQLGEKAGRIRIEVFDAASEEETMTISLPRRVPESRIAAARGNLNSLAPVLQKPSRVKTETKTETVNGKAVKREIIVADKEALKPHSGLKEVDFAPSGAPLAVELIQIVKP